MQADKRSENQFSEAVGAKLSLGLKEWMKTTCLLAKAAGEMADGVGTAKIYQHLVGGWWEFGALP